MPRSISPRRSRSSYEICEGIIRSGPAALTYTADAKAVLDGDPEVDAPPSLLHSSPEFEQHVSALRSEVERRSASVAAPSTSTCPSRSSSSIPHGNMARHRTRSERGWSHRLIEEFMLSANECVATLARSRWDHPEHLPHSRDSPTPNAFIDFEEVAASQFGQTHSASLQPAGQEVHP